MTWLECFLPSLNPKKSNYYKTSQSEITISGLTTIWWAKIWKLIFKNAYFTFKFKVTKQLHVRSINALLPTNFSQGWHIKSYELVNPELINWTGDLRCSKFLSVRKLIIQKTVILILEQLLWIIKQIQNMFTNEYTSYVILKENSYSFSWKMEKKMNLRDKRNPFLLIVIFFSDIPI